jgi:catechol 2,3-dioxygenase
MTDYKTQIGHTHLKVRDLERAVEFYTTYFDLNVTERVNTHYVFLSGNAMHHEIGLQAVGENAPAQRAHGVGLYHVAFEVPDKRAFAQAYQTLKKGGVDVSAVNHGISWALYFNDPDGNGLEIYADTRHEADGRDQWLGQSSQLTDEIILAALS